MKRILITGALALALSATSALAATNRKTEARVNYSKPAVTRPATRTSAYNQTAQSERTIRKVRHHHRRHHRHMANRRMTGRHNARA
jgi:hypothetical protein